MTRTSSDLVTDGTVKLWRQAPIGQLKAGELTSAVFKPSEEHEFVMSTDHGAKITAGDAFLQYSALELISGGTWMLLTSECRDEGLSAWEDGGFGDLADSHVSVPMGHIGRSRRDRIALNLKAFALEHRRQYPPEGVETRTSAI